MIDHEKIEQAVRLLLEGMGEDVNREGLIDTPDRIARMYEEIYGGMDEDAGKHLSKTFTVDSHEMVFPSDPSRCQQMESRSLCYRTDRAPEDMPR